MKKWTILILLLVCTTFFMLGVLWAQYDVITLESKKGNITFPHKEHADRGLKCTECHHKSAEGEQNPKPCRECHKKGADVSKMKAFHSKKKTTSCVGCHTKQGGKAPQYTPCSNCHKK